MSDAQRLIHGCQMVTPRGIVRSDILIQGEWIVAVAPDLAGSHAELIDATGLYALPGLIDCHVHLRDPGATHKEDFTTGTRAALAGGVTTVLDMPNNPIPTTSKAAFDNKVALGRAKACCDFGLFVGASVDNMAEVAGIAEAVGLKLYMGSSTGDLLVRDLETQLAHFSIFPADRPLAVHAEDEQAVQLLSVPENPRPPICAELAVARAVALARFTKRHLHICHVSTQQELALITLAKRQKLRVTAEVTPHHLFLTDKDRKRLGAKAAMNPPLRPQADLEALWRNLSIFNAIATDHAPHTEAEKTGNDPPAGVPGLETMLPLMLQAVSDGRLTLPELARLTAAGPAAVYRLPKKGHIAPGHHADIVLVDMQGIATLGEHFYSKCTWSPFAGREVRGRIRRVLLRGRDAMVDGEVLAQPGWGQFIAPSRCGTHSQGLTAPDGASSGNVPRH